MGLYNFIQASATPDQIKTELDAVQSDLMSLLTAGQGAGVGKLAAAAEWRFKAAGIIREAVTNTFRLKDPTPIFLDRRTLQHGDTYTFSGLINTLTVVEYAPNSEPLAFTPRKYEYKIGTRQYDMAWGLKLQQIINKQWTVGDFAQFSAEAMIRHQLDLVLGGVNTACHSTQTDVRGNNVRSTVTGGAITAPALNAAIKRLYGLGISGLTIFGSRYVLDTIFDLGATTDNLKEELNARGQIGTFRGARMVEVQDQYNPFYDAYTTVKGKDAGQTKALDSLVFITGNVPAGIFLEKDLGVLSYEEMDTRGATWHMGNRMEHSVFIHTPGAAHVIQIDA